MMTLVHSSYTEAAEAGLVTVGRYRQTGREVKLVAEAAAALTRLMAEADASGVGIVPISGFRTVKYQEALFLKAVAKHGSEAEAARWVARPGFSEHHTGLAVDLGDDAQPLCDVETSFEKTRAFDWLQENAGRFGFELSYPRGNSSGINYEPWHWRFVGTPEAKQIFQK